MPQHEEERPNIQKIPNRPKDLTDVSRAVLRSEQAKKWTKRYRTEVAASSSSLLSTFVAVRHVTCRMQRINANCASILSTRSRRGYKRTAAPHTSAIIADACQLQVQLLQRLRPPYVPERRLPWLLARYAVLRLQHLVIELTRRTGVWSPLLSITLVRTVSFSIYQRSKYAIDDWIYQATGSSPLVIANTRGAYPTLSTVACFGLAGAGAGATITAIACMQDCNL
jgi:solute carrier family 25 carnitine/acylcarnitine transporter 20/29